MITLINGTKTALALDYDYRKELVFWSDVAEKNIYKSSVFKDNKPEPIFSIYNTTSSGLAVDWIHDHIYYTDMRRKIIGVTTFNGSMSTVLVNVGLNVPGSIALDPLTSWMFWSQWGKNPGIERAGMDGSHRQALITSDVFSPAGITLDLVHKELYWTDARYNTIFVCGYEGENRRSILKSEEFLITPVSIALFENSLYWINWLKGFFLKMNKLKTDNQTIIASNVSK